MRGGSPARPLRSPREHPATTPAIAPVNASRAPRITFIARRTSYHIPYSVLHMCISRMSVAFTNKSIDPL
eukprot:2463753-Lingulodinium_polyedra.AAC.1